MLSQMARSTPRGAELLKAWRGERKQADVCSLVALDPATYNRIERGRIKPGFKRAFEIERGTGGMVPMQSWERTAAEKKNWWAA